MIHVLGMYSAKVKDEAGIFEASVKVVFRRTPSCCAATALLVLEKRFRVETHE